MTDYYNDFFNMFEDNLGESFFPDLFQNENHNLNENEFVGEEKNINNDNNSKSFKIKLIIEDANTKEKSETNKEIEQKTEADKETEQKNQKEEEKQIIYVPRFIILNDNEPNDDLIPILKKKRGRVKKGESKIIHNKYSDDNLRRKCKHLVLHNVMKFINDKIEEIYGNKGYGITMKKLLIINQKQISNATINFNKDFLNKKLSEIFSVNISTRYTNFRPEHNKNLISKLINDEDEIKSNYFKILFDLTFVECLRHFNGSTNIPILNGMTLFSQLNIENEIDEDYSSILSYYINKYEKIMERKIEKKSNIE